MRVVQEARSQAPSVTSPCARIRLCTEERDRLRLRHSIVQSSQGDVENKR